MSGAERERRAERRDFELSVERLLQRVRATFGARTARRSDAAPVGAARCMFEHARSHGQTQRHVLHVCCVLQTLSTILFLIIIVILLLSERV